MSEPTGQSAQSSGQQSRPRLRPGMPVTFRHPDPAGGVLEGHGLVLKVNDDGTAATVAPLSLLHLYVAADDLAPVKAEDVPTTIAQPEPEATGGPEA